MMQGVLFKAGDFLIVLWVLMLIIVLSIPAELRIYTNKASKASLYLKHNIPIENVSAINQLFLYER